MSARREGWASPETPRERQPTADDLPLRGWAETAVFIRLSWWEVGAGGGLKRPHNPKVVGSNPTPATKKPPRFHSLGGFDFYDPWPQPTSLPGNSPGISGPRPGRVKYWQSAVGNLLLAH